MQFLELQSLKQQNEQGKPFNITVIQVYAPTMRPKKLVVDQFYEDMQNF